MKMKANVNAVNKSIAASAARPVVSGLGVYTPAGESCTELLKTLISGHDSIESLGWPVLKDFMSNLASTFSEKIVVDGVSEDECSWMDRATLLTVPALQEALADAKIDLTKYDQSKIAVVLGSSHSGLIRTEEIAIAVFNGKLHDWPTEGLRKVAATFVSHCTAVIARMVGAKGRIITVSSACASSNSAIGIGADLIRNREADIVIVGGADTVSLSVLSGFNALRALSSVKTSPFGKNIGLNIGEGSGILILERLDAMEASGRIPRAEILGYGLSGDAYHAAAPDENGYGAEAAMRHALNQAGTSSDQIDYINAHGTGTDSNDIAEARAYRRMFGNKTPVSSLKSVFGHTLGASGAIELISTIVMAENKLAPAGLRQDTVREGCEGVDFISNVPRQMRVNTSLINNYGFGGNNSSLCIQLSIKTKNETALLDLGVSVVGAAIWCATGNESDNLLKSLSGQQNILIEACEETGVQICRANKPNFRTPELKTFARSSPVTKFSISSLMGAIGNDRGYYRDNLNAGLIAGFIFGAQKPTEKFMESVFQGDPSLANAHFFPMTTLNATGGQCSIAFGVKGFTTTVCGSAAALCYSLDLVRRSRQSRMAVTSADESTPSLLNLYKMCGALNSVPFGEGGVALSLEATPKAISRDADIQARITGWAHRQDPVDLGPLPSGDALQRALNLALCQAGIDRSEIKTTLVCASGVQAITTSVLRGARKFFGRSPPEWIELSPIIGLLPSAGALAHVYAGVQMIKANPEKSPIVVYGADLIGDSFAFVIEGTH